MTEFEKTAGDTLTKLQNALSDVIAEYGDPMILRPVDLCELISIDMNVAWKVSRLINSTDVFSFGKYLPGRKAFSNLCISAMDAGSTPAKVKELQNASAKLDVFIRTHAGSRKELELMLANLSIEERVGNDSVHRRKSFEGNSYTFGVQCDVNLSTNILIPSSDQNNSLHICRIRGQVGLRLIRPNVPWRVMSTYITDSTGKQKDSSKSEYLFCSDSDDAPVAREFCTPDLPEFGCKTSKAGRKSYFLKNMEMGIKSSINVFTVELMRNVGPMYAAGPDDAFALNSTSRIPAKSIVIEVYVPQQFDPSTCRTEMWSRLFVSSDPSEKIAGDILPLSEQPMIYPIGRASVPVPGISGYRNLINKTFMELEVNPKDYRLLRLTIDYPPIPVGISLMMKHPSE